MERMRKKDEVGRMGDEIYGIEEENMHKKLIMKVKALPFSPFYFAHPLPLSSFILHPSYLF